MSALELSIWAKVARRRRGGSKSGGGMVVVQLKLSPDVDVKMEGRGNFSIAELGRDIR